MFVLFKSKIDVKCKNLHIDKVDPSYDYIVYKLF